MQGFRGWPWSRSGAAALVRGAEDKSFRLTEASEIQSITGKGVEGKVEGRKVILGNAAMLQGRRVALDPARPTIAVTL